MFSIRKPHRFVSALETLVSKFSRYFTRTDENKAALETYIGYATARELMLRCRVLAQDQITSYVPTQSRRQRLRLMLATYFGPGLAGRAVRILGRDRSGFSDEAGHVRLTVPRIPEDEGVLLLAAKPVNGTGSRMWVVVPSERAEHLIIAAIDGSLVDTRTWPLLRDLWNTVMHNTVRQCPNPTTQRLIQTLSARGNPIAYISSAPWSFHAMLSEILFENGNLPLGPLAMRRPGARQSQFLSEIDPAQKMAEIQTLLDDFPHLKAILIGDVTQGDPSVFLQLLGTNTGRIARVILHKSRNKDMPHDAERAIHAMGILAVPVSVSDTFDEDSSWVQDLIAQEPPENHGADASANQVTPIADLKRQPDDAAVDQLLRSHDR